MKNFLVQIVASAFGAGLVLGTAFLLFVIVLAAAISGEPPAQVPAHGILVVDLSRPVTDRGPIAGPGSLTSALMSGGEAPVALRVVTESLRHAAKDARIAGVFLRGPAGDAGWASLREIAAAVADVKAAGKPVVAWAPNLDEKTLYVCASAKPLAVAPDGVVECDGLAAEVFYYAPALRKLGVEMEVTRVGKFKSAVEPFLLDGMSPENREQIEGYLGAIDRTFLAETTAARGLAAGTLENLAATTGAISAADAVRAGIADETMTFDAVLAALAKILGKPNDPLAQVALPAYAAEVRAGQSTEGAGGKVAVVYAEGEIAEGYDEDAASGDLVAERLRRAWSDDSVKAVVLRVNSPGGSAQASETILQEVRLVRTKKPLVVSMGDVAASGGYWIASVADEIVAHPNTITGSIGVFGMKPNVAKLAEDVGVRVEVVKTGPFADAGSMFRRATPGEATVRQTFVDRVYDDFLARVAEGRSLPRDGVQEIAQGRVWAGQQALDRKLVDAFGGLDEAVRRAAARAKLGAGHGVLHMEPEPKFFQRIAADIGGEQRPLAGVSEVAAIFPGAGDLAASVRTLRAFRRGGVFARLPYGLTIR